MFPWLLWWSPSFYFPFSGAVNQDIETDWFSREISPESGDANVERTVVRDVASYGTQLGLLNEAVLALANELQSETIEENKAIRKLKELQKEIRAVKNLKKDKRKIRAREILDQLAHNSDPESLASLLENYAQELRNQSNNNNSNSKTPEIIDLTP